jgi:myxalamid-type polyketide synthase MxaE and MxaD
MRPLHLDGEMSIQIVLKPASDGSSALQFHARRDGLWREHANGRAIPRETANDSAWLDAAEVQERLTHLSVADFHRRLAEQGVDYGPPFQKIERLWAAEGEALALVAAQELTAAPLDCALQALIAASGVEGAGWMQSVERLRLNRPIGPRFWSHARVRSRIGGRVYGDVRIYCEDGKPAGELVGVSAAPVRADLSGIFEAQWIRRPDSSIPTLESNGVWLLIGDGAADELRANFERWRGRAVVIPAADVNGLRRILDGLAREVQGIVYLAAAAAEANDGAPAMAENRCRTTLEVMQAILATRWQNAPAIWLATRNAYAVTGEGGDPGHAAVWGLGRVLANEHPEFFVGMADLDGKPESWSKFAGLLLSGTEEREIAVRSGEVHLHRLARVGNSVEARPSAISPDASYLVVGGLSGLGIESARLLVRRGARCVWLVGRSGLSRPESVAAVENLRAGGAQIVVEQCDVGDVSQVGALLARMQIEAPPLRGIIHSAGVVEDAAIGCVEWSGVSRVFHPKVHGAWNLHRLTVDLPLEFFILFSSAAALLGPMGQASHAAACAYMDALAHWRRSQGLTALSINWGPWSESGAAAGAEITTRLGSRGIRSIGSERGLRMLETAMGRPESQLLALDVDWPQWAASLPHAQAGSMWHELSGRKPIHPSTPSLPDVGFRRSPATASVSKEPSALLRDTVATLLGVPAGHLDDRRRLAEYGFDSLMTISLRRRVEAELGTRIPIVHFFHSQTLHELTTMVAEQTAR